MDDLSNIRAQRAASECSELGLRLTVMLAGAAKHASVRAQRYDVYEQASRVFDTAGYELLRRWKAAE